jgi:hypothetical protein
MLRSPEEIQELLSTKRLHERPKYYSRISKSYVSISYEYESHLILMENSEKNELITRLRRALKDVSGTADRDLLLKQAAQYENAASSAIVNDLSLDVGDFSSISSSYVDPSLGETSQLISVLGSSLGPKLALLDQASYDTTASSLILSALDGNDAKEKRTQMQSWINVITAYVTGS